MKKIVALMICSLLAGCNILERREKTKRLEVPSTGLEYHNQDTAPLPWISIVPSERALALEHVNFDALARRFRHSMAFDPQSKPFEDVRLVVLDYTILPRSDKKAKKSQERPERYFMTASFYKIGNKPPCPPDFEVTASIRAILGGRRESMQYMAREIIEEIHLLSDAGFLTPGKKVTINLD